LKTANVEAVIQLCVSWIYLRRMWSIITLVSVIMVTKCPFLVEWSRNRLIAMLHWLCLCLLTVPHKILLLAFASYI